MPAPTPASRSRLRQSRGRSVVVVSETFRAAPLARPGIDDLLENPLPELVAGVREREGDVRMQALEMLRRMRSADPEFEGGPVVRPAHASCELVANASLLARCTSE